MYVHVQYKNVSRLIICIYSIVYSNIHIMMIFFYGVYLLYDMIMTLKKTFSLAFSFLSVLISFTLVGVSFSSNTTLS